jgi:hypothetical protein
MYRASPGLRLLSAGTELMPAMVNQLALPLQDGKTFPGPAVTNNPDGWTAYTHILQDVRDFAGCLPGSAGRRPARGRSKLGLRFDPTPAFDPTNSDPSLARLIMPLRRAIAISHFSCPRPPPASPADPDAVSIDQPA